MSQDTIEAGQRDQRTSDTTGHRPTRAPMVKNDLLPFMVLLGAFYGWVVVAIAVVVAAIVVLVT